MTTREQVRYAEYHITMYQGADWSMTINVLDKDLTDYGATMQIRSNPGGILYDTLSTDGSGISINTATSAISLSRGYEQTAEYGFVNGAYDLFLTHSGSSTATPLLHGNVKLLQRVTVL